MRSEARDATVAPEATRARRDSISVVLDILRQTTNAALSKDRKTEDDVRRKDLVHSPCLYLVYGNLLIFVSTTHIRIAVLLSSRRDHPDPSERTQHFSHERE